MQLITRIAPSANGYLHIGNVFNFLVSYIEIKKNNGIITLRIDDADLYRCKKEYIDEIFRTLEWLEIDLDFGPKTTQAFLKDFSQTLKFEYYRNKLKMLDTYVCNCSRKSIIKYKCDCINKSLHFKRYETSIHVKGLDNNNYSDSIVWRKEDIPSNLLTSTIDDIDLGVNFLVRGNDLISFSKYQKNLTRYLNINTEYKEVFHETIKDGKYKLSKSSKSASFKEYSKNHTFKDLINEFSKKINIEKNLVTNIHELVSYFVK